MGVQQLSQLSSVVRPLLPTLAQLSLNASLSFVPVSVSAARESAAVSVRESGNMNAVIALLWILVATAPAWGLNNHINSIGNYFLFLMHYYLVKKKNFEPKTISFEFILLHVFLLKCINIFVVSF